MKKLPIILMGVWASCFAQPTLSEVVAISPLAGEQRPAGSAVSDNVRRKSGNCNRLMVRNQRSGRRTRIGRPARLVELPGARATIVCADIDTLVPVTITYARLPREEFTGRLRLPEKGVNSDLLRIKQPGPRLVRRPINPLWSEEFGPELRLSPLEISVPVSQYPVSLTRSGVGIDYLARTSSFRAVPDGWQFNPRSYEPPTGSKQFKIAPKVAAGESELFIAIKNFLLAVRKFASSTVTLVVLSSLLVPLVLWEFRIAMRRRRAN